MKCVYKRSVFLLSTLGILLFTSAGMAPRFPEMEMTTLDGRSVDAAYFGQDNTVVLHFFIGCHAAMLAVRDLQDLQKQDGLNYQLLYVAENTPSHIADFNSEEENTWSSIRKHYKLEPLTGDVVAICESENVREYEGNLAIGQHCDTFAKRVKTKTSPTFIYVNRDMKIRKKEKGYLTVSDTSELRGRIVRNFK